jgi:hypothetical protein
MEQRRNNGESGEARNEPGSIEGAKPRAEGKSWKNGRGKACSRMESGIMHGGAMSEENNWENGEARPGNRWE